MSYPCPFCRTPADPATGCPGCGRAPDPDAAEVVRLDAQIPVLAARLRQAQEAMAGADAELRDAWQRRDAAAARVRAAVSATLAAAVGTAAGTEPGTVPTPPAGLAPQVVPAPQVFPAPRVGLAPQVFPAPQLDPAPQVVPAPNPEASTRRVQNALFLLGGLLLAVAAIVFTTVAWSQFGVGGRAALLAAFTAATLAVPPLALRRGLSATAETFAALGLLLVLLDGYAAWHVDLFGIADGSPAGYGGAVFALTAAVAVGYRTVTGLTGPRFAALLAAQPVLPLVAVPFEPDAIGWAATLTAVAVVDLLVVHLHRDRTGGASFALRVCGHVLGGAALLGTGVCTLAVLAVAERPGSAARAGAVLVAAALVVVAATVSARVARAQAVAAGGLVVAVAVAAGPVVSILGGSAGPVLVAALVVALAGVVTGTGRWLPAAVRRGPWAGALVTVGVPLLGCAGDAVVAAGRSIMAARPVFAADPGAPAGDLGWQTAAMLALLTAGLVALLPRTHRIDAALCGAALTAFALPAGAQLPWWSAAGIDIVVVGAAVTVALRAAAAAVPATVAAVLAAHAVVVSLGRPGVAAATLAAVVLLGLGTAVAAGSGRRRVLGGFALAVALTVVPGMLWSAGAAIGLADRWQSRVALAAVVLPLAASAVVARRWPDRHRYALAAVLLSVGTAPSWASWSGDSTAVYAALALLVVALAGAAVPATVPDVVPASSASPVSSAGLVGSGGSVSSAGSIGSGGVVGSGGVASSGGSASSAGLRPQEWAAVAAVVPALALFAATAPSAWTVLAAPYGWLARMWDGRPDGVGVDPLGVHRVLVDDAVAVTVLACAVAVAGYSLRRSARTGRRPTLTVLAVLAVLAVALPMWAAALGASWPAAPAASIGGGLAVALAVALGRPAARPAGAAVRLGTAAVAAVLVGAGLAGALPTHAATLAALAGIGTAGAAAGAAGRTLAARITGWLATVCSAALFAFTAGRAFDLAPAAAAFGVLATSAVALSVGAALGRRRPVEAVAVQAAAHAGAMAALLLTAGSVRYAAAVCTLWGLVLGLRSLWPGESTGSRRRLVVAAAGAELAAWWLLIAAEQVSLAEAYTLPGAAVALLAGWLALRSRPGLTSWAAYGPALAAALLPSLASVLVADGQPVRRLLLGLGALAVVLAGAYTRLQAPVVAGGVVLVAVALHELVLVWDLLPRWIPLAIGGLLLVGLAMTLERRRRDLARIRAEVGRLG